MAEESLARRVADELRLAGLAPRAGSEGGASVEARSDRVFVVWTASSELVDRVAAGRVAGVGDSGMRHLGRIIAAMEDAILIVLRSAGLDAEPSGDDMMPGVIEVVAGAARLGDTGDHDH